MTRTVQWTTGDGREVVVVATADYEMDDHGNSRTRGLKTVVVSATLAGADQGTWLREGRRPNDPAVVVAYIGAIGIVQANYDRIVAAIAELEAAIAQHNAACEANAAEVYSAIDAAMRLERSMAYGEAN